MSDLQKSITSGLFSFLSIILMYYGTKAGSFLFGLLLGIICLYIAFRFLKSVSPETQAAASKLMEEQKNNSTYTSTSNSECFRNLLMAVIITNLTANMHSCDHEDKS